MSLFRQSTTLSRDLTRRAGVTGYISGLSQSRDVNFLCKGRLPRQKSFCPGHPKPFPVHWAPPAWPLIEGHPLALDLASQIGFVDTGILLATVAAAFGLLFAANLGRAPSPPLPATPSPPNPQRTYADEDWDGATVQANSSQTLSDPARGESPGSRPSLTQRARATSRSGRAHTIAGPCSNVIRPQGEPMLMADAVWAAAWKPFQTGSSNLVGVPGDMGPDGEAVEEGTTRAQGTAVRRPVLALQGIEPRVRGQLLAVALVALERHIAALPDQALRASAQEWGVLLPALLGSCSVAAAQAWLGYSPPSLSDDAERAFRRIAAEVGSSGSSTNDARPSSDPPRTTTAESTPSTSGWDSFADRSHLHATVTRYLRFGRAPATVGSGATVDPPPNEARSVSLPHMATERPRNAGPHVRHAAADGGHVGPKGTHVMESNVDQGLQLWADARKRASQLLDQRSAGIRGWDTRAPDPQIGLPMSAAPALGVRSAPELVQDMAVGIADSVAAAYLAEAGVGFDGGPARASSRSIEAGSWPTFLHPRLANTRALERFRNQRPDVSGEVWIEIALQQWWEQRWGAVAAIYEDRHEVWGIGPRGSLLRRSIPGRRAAELERLRGWRYALSLFLEALDVAAPLAQAAVSRAGAAISWLLVGLIGRSLGLVYRGVRQSLGGRRGKPDAPPGTPGRRQGGGPARQPRPAW